MAASLHFLKQNCGRQKNDVIVSPLIVGGSLSQSRAFWAIYISVAISYLGVGLVAPLIAIVLSEHDANPFVIGLVGTTMFAAFTVGVVSDRVDNGPRRPKARARSRADRLRRLDNSLRDDKGDRALLHSPRD